METAIKQFIENAIPELAGHIYPGFTTEMDRLSVSYVFTPISGGHLKQSMLELKVIGPDYDACKSMERNLSELLDMEEDEPYIAAGAVYFHSGLSGGGYLFNDGCQMHEVTLYFILDWRLLH